MIISVALMNLVTAVLVESAIAQGKSKKRMEEKQRKVLRPKIEIAFAEIDVYNEGKISREAWSNAKLPPVLKKLMPDADRLAVFDFLDINDCGEISKKKFVDGIVELKLTDVSFENLYRLQLMKQMRRQLSEIHLELLCTKKYVECAVNGLEA